MLGHEESGVVAQLSFVEADRSQLAKLAQRLCDGRLTSNVGAVRARALSGARRRLSLDQCPPLACEVLTGSPGSKD